MLTSHAQSISLPLDEARLLSIPLKGIERAAVFVLLTAGVLLSAHFLTSGFERVLGTFEDDSFYYLTIARRIAAGQGSTFDGIHLTNGYHPLWCAFLVAPMSVFRDRPEAAVRAIAVVSVWLRVASSLLLLRLAARAFSDRIAAALAAITFFVVGNAF